jgi:hypothetical protein
MRKPERWRPRQRALSFAGPRVPPRIDLAETRVRIRPYHRIGQNRFEASRFLTMHRDVRGGVRFAVRALPDTVIASPLTVLQEGAASRRVFFRHKKTSARGRRGGWLAVGWFSESGGSARFAARSGVVDGRRILTASVCRMCATSHPFVSVGWCAFSFVRRSRQRRRPARRALDVSPRHHR